MSPSSNLPSFKSPPVHEVVLGVQFAPIAKLDVRHAGLMWNRIRARFPTVEVRPPLDPQFERFGQARPAPHVKLEITELPLFPRVWFVDATRTEILQLQKDRLLHNWRRVRGDETYPRYGYVRGQFEQDLLDLTSFLHSEGIDPPSPNQCEATYVNHIFAGEKGSRHSDPSQIFRLFRAGLSFSEIGQTEGTSLTSRFVVSSKDSRGMDLFGRLYVELLTAVHAETERPMYVFTLTVRGGPATPDVGGVLAFLDFARERIVTSFASLTSEKMHHEWGRLA